MLLFGQRHQLQTDFITHHANNLRREDILLLAALKQQVNFLPFQHFRLAVDFDPQTTVREVVDGTGEEMAIFTGDRRRHADFNAMRTTNLFALHRHRYRATENNQVVEDPGHTHEDGQDFVLRAVEVTPDPGDDAHNIQQHQEDIRTGDHPVDILLFHQPALRGVPGQHRFVNFTPEGVAVFTLYLRVRQARVDHMRQNEQRNHQRGCVNDIGVKEQERQRRGQEDEPRDTGQEVEHGVDVAKTLRQLKPFAYQRVIETENLHHAARPANTLANVRRQ